MEHKGNVLLTVCFSLESRSSINFSKNYLWRPHLVSLILQRLPCSVSLALFSLSYISSFYVWQFFYYQISFWIRFPPCLITSVLLSVLFFFSCLTILLLVDLALLLFHAFWVYSLVSYFCLLLIFLLSRLPFFSAYSLKRYTLLFKVTVFQHVVELVYH